VVLISPPVGFIDFNGIGGLSSLKLVVSGSRDDIAPPDLIRRMLPDWNPAAHFEIIDGSDHFYGRYNQQLKDVIDKHIEHVDNL
jgi:alpha/beta superfamily hydrolase